LFLAIFDSRVGRDASLGGSQKVKVLKSPRKALGSKHILKPPRAGFTDK